MAFGFFKKKDRDATAPVSVIHADAKAELPQTHPAAGGNQAQTGTEARPDVLVLENIRLGLASCGKTEAIATAGGILEKSGYVREGYAAAMQDREQVLTTYIGNGVAIPHGVGASRDLIVNSGICVLQYPDGVDFGDGKRAFLVVGIAGRGQEHMAILTNLAELVTEEETVMRMARETDPNALLQAFTAEQG